MLPNMLLRIIIDKNEALRRIEHRGKVDVRPKTLSYLNDSDSLIDQAINHINGKENKVKIIDLDGENQLNSNLKNCIKSDKKYKIDTSL